MIPPQAHPIPDGVRPSAPPPLRACFFAAAFRRLAETWPLPATTAETAQTHYETLNRAGGLVIGARDIIPHSTPAGRSEPADFFPRLHSLIDWHTTPNGPMPEGMVVRRRRSPCNLFIDISGQEYVDVRNVNGVVAPELDAAGRARRRFGGLMPALFGDAHTSASERERHRATCEFLAGVIGAVDDDSAFFQVSEVLRMDPRFSAAQCSKFLDANADKIRSKRPAPNRRLVNVPDWVRYWSAADRLHDRIASQDEDAYVEEVAKRTGREREKKRPKA